MPKGAQDQTVSRAAGAIVWATFGLRAHRLPSSSADVSQSDMRDYFLIVEVEQPEWQATWAELCPAQSCAVVAWIPLSACRSPCEECQAQARADQVFDFLRLCP